MFTVFTKVFSKKSTSSVLGETPWHLSSGSRDLVCFIKLISRRLLSLFVLPMRFSPCWESKIFHKLEKINKKFFGVDITTHKKMNSQRSRPRVPSRKRKKGKKDRRRRNRKTERWGPIENRGNWYRPGPIGMGTSQPTTVPIQSRCRDLSLDCSSWNNASSFKRW